MVAFAEIPSNLALELSLAPCSNSANLYILPNFAAAVDAVFNGVILFNKPVSPSIFAANTFYHLKQ